MKIKTFLFTLCLLAATPAFAEPHEDGQTPPVSADEIVLEDVEGDTLPDVEQPALEPKPDSETSESDEETMGEEE